MDFGTFRRQPELKFDQNAVDVYIIANKPFLKDIIKRWTLDLTDEKEIELNNMLDNSDIEELIEATKKLLYTTIHLDVEFKRLGGEYYLNLEDVDEDPFHGEYDDYKLVEFNISSYKYPTFIIAINE